MQRALWRRLTSSLTTHRNPELAGALAGQVRAARDGTAVAMAMVSKKISSADARRQIADVERHGDELRRDLVERLSKTLVAPLDREDLFRLSRSIDDVLDTIRDFVREADLYQIENRKTYLPLIANVITALESLDDAVAALWSAPQRVPLEALRTKKAAHAISRGYQQEFAKIVDGAMSPNALKHRELIKRLDWVGVRISDAADVLTDGALKRGY